jgi:cell wall-associated NlpC family hydrolase
LPRPWPRTTYTQARFVQSKGGWTTSITQLSPGDLVFFAGSDGTLTNPGHVGIYLGNHQMIQSPETGQVVDVVDITASFAGGFSGGGPV